MLDRALISNGKGGHVRQVDVSVSRRRNCVQSCHRDRNWISLAPNTVSIIIRLLLS